MGRGLFASKNIIQGELIIAEKVLAVANDEWNGMAFEFAANQNINSPGQV